jgi:phosphatidate cytidylyltransferase
MRAEAASMHDDSERSEGGWAARLGNDFIVRLLSGLAMAAAVALLTLSGPTPFALLVLTASVLVGWEWARLVHGPEAGILLVVQLVSVAIAGLLAAFLSVGLGLLVLPIGAILATLLSLGRNSFLAGLGVLYAGFPAVVLIWLRSGTPPDQQDPWLGMLAVFFLILIVATADTAAFVCGRLLRGPLLWPEVSPNKTWAGFLGAVGATALVGGLFALAVPGASVLRLAVVGALLALVAQGGDLAESSLKRRFGAKDAGSILPGHGGVMDRVDGLVAAASAVGLAAMVIDMHSPARALLLGS